MIKTYLINSSTAQYTDEELQWLQSNFLEAGILGDKDTGSLGFEVSEQGTPAMNVDVSAGKALVEVTISGKTFKVIVESGDVETVAIPGNVSGSNRVDAIIIRIDKDTEPNTLKTNVGTVERVAGDGPTALSDADIDTAVSGDGWYRLADVTVVDSATEIENLNISDLRSKVATNRSIEITDFLGTITNDSVTQSAALENQTSFINTIGLGEEDSTTNKSEIAQKFTASKSKIKGARLYKKADAGTFTGDIVVSVQASVLGKPSGISLAEDTIANAEWLKIPDNTIFYAEFESEYNSLNIDSDYWIVANPTTSDNVNHPNLGGITSGGSGNLSYYNSADDWTQIISSDLYFEVIEGVNSQIPKTSDTGGTKGTLSIPVTNVYTSDDVWIKPVGLSYIVVEVVGAGGAGRDRGGGGGAGAYAKKIILSSELGSAEEIIVGVGAADTNGTSSTFTINGAVSITAGGGQWSPSTYGGDGGTATGGDINIYGGDGGTYGGQDTGSGGSQNNTGGMGGASYFGSGGHGGPDNYHGVSGRVYGSGGGGGGSDGGQGAAGAPGVIIITEFY